RTEFRVAMLTTFGVIWLDLLHGILLAVGISLLILIKRASRPLDSLLGRVSGLRGWHEVASQADAMTHPGLVVYRFGASIVFFNADFFKRRVLEVIAGQPDAEWFVLDGSTINLVDVTGAEVLDGLVRELAARGIRFGLANVRAQVHAMLERTGVLDRIGKEFV